MIWKYLGSNFHFSIQIRFLAFMFVGTLKPIDMKKLKEIDVYVSGRCRNQEEKGAYGYVIKSESYNSTNKKTCSQTTSNRMEMKAVIDSMLEISNEIKDADVINIYTKQGPLIRSMINGDCKMFHKRPNQDLVRVAIKIKSRFSIYIFNISANQHEEMEIANNLSKLALEADVDSVDVRDDDLPKSVDLLFGI